MVNIRGKLSAALLTCYIGWVSAGEAAEIVIQTKEKFGDAIKAASLIVEANANKESTPQDLVAAARADYGRITGAFYEEGYYSPIINILIDGREAATIPLLASPSSIRQITIRAVSGPRFEFSRAVASPLAQGTVLPKRFAKGRPARSTAITAAGDVGVKGWRDAGHAKAKINYQNYTADHQKKRLSAEIGFDPGPRLTFGNLILKSDSDVRPDRIREIAGLPTGEVYSPEEIDLAAQRLRDAGAFRSIALRDAEKPGPDNTLDIEATVVDEKKHRFGVGAEVYSEDGVTLSAFWLHRNLFGGGERLKFDLEVSGIGGNSGGTDYQGGVRFERPATFDPDTDLYLDARYAHLNEINYKQDNATIGGGVMHRFSKELTGELGVGFRYSRFKDDFGRRKAYYLMLPARLTWDSRDDPINATEGYYLDGNLTPFVGVNNGNVGTRLYADARTYRKMGTTDRVVLAGRVLAGSLMGPRARHVPPDMLFFSGGAGTVRGHKYQSLGVDVRGKDDDIGGRSFLGLSGEARVKIKNDMGLVSFVDGGYVAEDPFGGGKSDWQGGAGLGFRYYTSIGPIRFDVATPLDHRAGKKYELYIGIGQAF